MKINRIWLASLMVATFIACLIVNVVHAQDMSIWTGKWFKVNVTYSGRHIDESGVISPYKETEVIYIKFLNVDEPNKVIDYYKYSYRDDEWQRESEFFRYLGGSSLDFLLYYILYEEDGDFLGFTARVQGKMKGGILTSATIKSLWGFEVEVWRVYEKKAGAVTLTGSLIPESKLPSGIPK